MLLYGRLASLLEEIACGKRGEKARIASEFLAGLEEEDLAPSVRLMLGNLWPCWEPREMGLGQEIMLNVLEEISLEDIGVLRKTLGEMGAVTEAALMRKSQRLLSSGEMAASFVYRNLLRISDQSGAGSDYRKAAILKGLFLEASPIEGKYISRAVMGNTIAGLGPKTMISAISNAFSYSFDEIERAYLYMPDLGMVALDALKQRLDNAAIEPPRPIRFTQLRKDGTAIEAYLKRYQGLSVQVHGTGNKFYAYTARLKNISSALAVLFNDLRIKNDFVIDAVLVGFQDGRLLERSNIINYINRRHFSRRSRVSPALIAVDLFYIDGEDLTGSSYAERRRRIISIFGSPKVFPFAGISSAEEIA